jgi:prepilin-type N-terminal cleavage/methylation domain-containing protein
MTEHKVAAVASAHHSGFPPDTRRNNVLTTVHTTPKRANRFIAKQHARSRGFTLAELLVTIGVLVVLMLLFTQLFNNAATVTTLGHKQMDADSGARELLDRMAIDVMQMVKRPDVYYHLKSSTTATDCPFTTTPPECGTQPGNDEMAFYSNVPGFYPSGTSGDKQGSVSLVGYRINTSATTLANKMERLGAGLIWNGVSTGNVPTNPVLFWTALDPWNTAKYASNSTFDIVGPNVFRFEYYYLLTDGTLRSTPWKTTSSSVRGMQDVAAIVTDIAVVDPKSRAQLTDAQVTTLRGILSDYNGQAPGGLLSNWRTAIDTNTSLPRVALSSIRLYERFLYLSPPTLLTP